MARTLIRRLMKLTGTLPRLMPGSVNTGTHPALDLLRKLITPKQGRTCFSNVRTVLENLLGARVIIRAY